jgi:hypothetical protein
MRLLSIRSLENGQLWQERNVRIPLTGGIRELPVESQREIWLRRVGRLISCLYEAAAAFPKSRLIVYGVFFSVITMTVLASLPHLRFLLWPGSAWALLAVSVVVAMGVIVNILVAMMSMYIGYCPVNDSSTATSTRVTGESAFLEGAEPTRRRADALQQLRMAERDLCQLQERSAFQLFSDQQKYQYYQLLEEVRRLTRDVSTESSMQKMAS